DVVEMGVLTLRLISFAYPFYAWGMILVQAFNGAGDTMTPTWINVFCFWLFQIPLAWMLSKYLMSPNGIVWAILAADIAMTVVGGILFLRGKWKEKALSIYSNRKRKNNSKHQKCRRYEKIIFLIRFYVLLLNPFKY
ncbi:MAG: hypothetical protein EB157_04015, partial [Euryarchaeota archaeon]|nr:hypothetical protein [Euryarchaeota archaeon]